MSANDLVSTGEAVSPEASKTPWLHDATYERGRGGFTLSCARWSTLPGLTAVIGLNGAGKSTLLGLLGGLRKPTHGTSGGWAGTTLLPQGARLRTRQTVEDVLTYIAALRGVPRRTRADEVDRVLVACGLSSWRHQRLDRLSAGWCQRVLVAQCLFGAPKALLLDEPTSSLDVSAAREVWTLISRVAASFPVVVATHEASASLEFCDRLAAIHAGTVGPVQDGDHLRTLHKAHGGSPESFLLTLIEPAAGV